MSEHLCLIDGCRDIGRHLGNCRDQRCRGCQPRTCEHGHACNPCRTRIAAELADLPHLHAQLTQTPDPIDRAPWTSRQHVPVPTTDPDRKPAWTWTPLPGSDPLNAALPAGPINTSRQARISGTRDQPAPTNLHVLDLAAGARHGSRAPHARGVLGTDQDQIGHLSVATELDTWVRDWRDARDLGEHLPVPTVASLTDWLTKRLDWACDHHEAVDEFAADIRNLRTTMRTVLGLNAAKPEPCRGVPCRSCDLIALTRADGAIHCGHCGLYYSERDYADWTGWLAAYEKQRAAA